MPEQKRFIVPAAFAIALLAGCAGVPILADLIGSRVSVSVPAELPLPDTLTLELGKSGGAALGLGNQVMGLLGGESIEAKLGRSLKSSAAPLRKAGADTFKRQLEDAHLFGSVVNSGGNVGLSLGVERWGLAYNAATQRLEPVLDLEATLSAPGIGVVWRGVRTAKDLSSDLISHLGGLDIPSLVSKPEAFQLAMGKVSTELSRQLIDDLRKNPPQWH